MLRVAVVYGGASKMEQFKALRAGVDILVATPVFVLLITSPLV
jgi:ATP-dependent RNA helicase DDX42